jgi:UDP:flavonoid glycosyltransferase YjiC (YdhE family)
VHGVPQIITAGRYWDEIGFGRHLEARGAGMLLEHEELSGDTVRGGPDGSSLHSRIARILDDPSFLRNAGVIQQEILATPTPRALVAELEELTAGHRS